MLARAGGGRAVATERVTVDGGCWISCKKLDVPPPGQLAECTIASGQGGGRSGTTADNWRSVLTCSDVLSRFPLRGSYGSGWLAVMVLSVVV